MSNINVLQNAEVRLPVGRGHNVNVLQNITVQKDQYCLDPDENPFLFILGLAPEGSNRIEWTLNKLVEAAWHITGNLQATGEYLGINRATVRKRLKLCKQQPLAKEEPWEPLLALPHAERIL